MAGKVAHEIALEVILTAYPNDDDGRTTLELTVHVLTPEGFQVRGEALRRPPMSEAGEVRKEGAPSGTIHHAPGRDSAPRYTLLASGLSRPRSWLTLCLREP